MKAYNIVLVKGIYGDGTTSWNLYFVVGDQTQSSVTITAKAARNIIRELALSKVSEVEYSLNLKTITYK